MATAEKPVLSSYAQRMDKAVQALKEEFAGLRTGRASANLLDQVTVDAYGSQMPLNQVASISVPEPAAKITTRPLSRWRWARRRM